MAGKGLRQPRCSSREVTDGDTDGAVGFGELGEALVDGLGEDGPEVFFGRGIVRVGGDQDDFVILGQSFGTFLRQGQ